MMRFSAIRSTSFLISSVGKPLSTRSSWRRSVSIFSTVSRWRSSPQLFVIVNSAMFAYAITQLKFRSRTLLYFVVMGSYMLPGAVTYIPSYITLANMGLARQPCGPCIIECCQRVRGVLPAPGVLENPPIIN